MDVYKQIKAERRVQDAQWGGPEHDDNHTLSQWLDIIDRHKSRLWHVLVKQQMGYLADQEAHQQSRDRLLKIAAICVAAIEALDRQDGEDG